MWTFKITFSTKLNIYVFKILHGVILMADKNYIVYEVQYKNKIVYIGSGLKGREEHVKSGCSGNKDLNKLYFEDGKNVDVIILREGLTKEESLETEKDFIMASEPIYNKQHNQKNHKIKKFRKYTV